MSSKRRPVSASFKKDGEKGTTQRSRPSTARSARSLNASFKSDVSGLSITGTKTVQSKPTSRQRQSLNLSYHDKNEHRPSNSTKSKKDDLRFGHEQDGVRQSADGKKDKRNSNKHSSSDPVEKFEAEKDDPWWENIPDEITFSPASSFSYASSTSDCVKRPFNARNDELRPSMNDFLDLSDESKTNLVEESTPKHKENNSERVKSPYRSPGQHLDGSIKIENNLREERGRLDENFEVGNKISKTDETTPRNASEIPRLVLDENSGKFDQKYRKTPRDENYLKFGADSQNFDQNSRTFENGEYSHKFGTGYQKSLDKKSWKTDRDENDLTFGSDFQNFDQMCRKSSSDHNSGKIERDENSQKFGTNSRNSSQNSRKNEKEYKPENFQSNFPLDEWQRRDGLETGETDRKKEEDAALTIQRCYRGYKTRMQVGYSAVQKALDERRAIMERQKKWDSDSNSSVDKQRRRDEKARQARQAAIEELNQKRERKKDDNKRMAKEELKFLEESGKVSKARNKQPKQKKVVKKSSMKTADHVVEAAGNDQLPRPGTASTLDSKVEEIFQESRTNSIQAGSQHMNENPSEASTSRTEKTAKNSVVSGTKSTLDDLFESLRQLEEEPADIKKEEKTSTYSWLDASDSKQKLTEDAVRQSTNSSVLSQEKLRTIMSFLDEVEKTEQDTVVSRVRDTKTFAEASSVSASFVSPRAVEAEKEIALLESASAAASDVTNAMMSVKVELDEKKKTNELLQRALNQQREFTLRQARDMEKDAKQRLDLQRQEYESTIQRHLSFIDQLIDDKKILSERCEELVKKLKETDKKYVDKISSLEQNHAAEIKKQKDVMQTAEKLRRDKWIKDKSQQIKELTVKGLEPDIQKLIAKHKAEIKRLKSTHQADLLETDERVGRRYLHQIEELREQLEREKDTACNRERDLAQTKFQKQMEEEEQAFQQQRRRLYAEIQEEKERLASQAQKQRKELDDLKEKLEESHKATMNSVEHSSKLSLEELEHKHQTEMKELKERLEIEKQQWIENYMKKQDAMLLQKERELKENVRESRDKEIELVIRRLEEETSHARDECERAAENRIKRVRDKYEAEMQELEKSEKVMHEKYTTAKEQCNEFEEEVSRLKTSVKNEERKLEDLNKLTKQLQEERGQVVDIIRQEFADRLVTTDEDNKRLKIEMSELRAKHRLEVERINNAKEEEMEEVHKRVKQAISKKEETLKSLRQQKESAEKRADHLEFLLHEQRKKLLS
ncbi:centrosomal of 131 kDa isoform X2 [Paramuricea clavata]|uniref:Centrosomal of 131 kDa isoform X2 n=1 Tax=Paramuricea clavata TaxID=317549 RepID=A0A6S7GMD9_PARCT|nr:centrosomal of 131 kDa isoform X2 [Paramuricea clavata]